ncbi:MAG TPA: regulatory protein RecX [Streptosporangiaceae bacterium]|nr:regulatory protein RecX [Streptosporangiaceae bacterium]
MTGRRGEPGSSGGRSASGGGRRQRNDRHQIAGSASGCADAERASEPVSAERADHNARRQQGSGRAEAGSGRAEAARAIGGAQGESGTGRAEAARGIGRAQGESGTGRAEAAGADPEEVARQICLRLLSAAPRTAAQLAAALRRRGVPEDAAATVLARFAEVKLVDDEVFAKAWVESRHYGRGLASRALGAELRQRGVAPNDIDAALGQLGPEQELATARELVERRLPATEGMPPLARMRRLTGVLARKGYSAGFSYRVVREVLDQESGSGPVPFDEDEFLPEPDEEAPAEAY